MGDVVARSTEPTLAAIKLAWWRERLEELDQGRVPAEPRLQAAAHKLLPRGIKGADLAELEAGWAALLQEEPDANRALQRGATLFRLAARILDGQPPECLDVAGRLYAAGSQRRHGVALEARAAADRPRIPRRYRPLTGLAALARRDLRAREPEGTPARAFTLVRHWLTGRL